MPSCKSRTRLRSSIPPKPRLLASGWTNKVFGKPPETARQMRGLSDYNGIFLDKSAPSAPPHSFPCRTLSFASSNRS